MGGNGATVKNRGALPAGLRFSHPAAFLATWFGAGLLPKAPGTWGSLAALPLAWIIQWQWGNPGLAAAAVAVFAVGLWAAGVFLRHGSASDPGAIVIDEVAGQWLVLLAVEPGIVAYASGFLLFRVFDILKPWPVSWIDRGLGGGPGIMLDDTAAAVYAGLVLYAGRSLLGG